MPFQLSFRHGCDHAGLSVKELILVGFGGRDDAQAEVHIAQMELQGVKLPRKT